MKIFKIKILTYTFFAGILAFGNSCKKEDSTPEIDSGIEGCMDMEAFNYNASATKKSNNCTYLKTTVYEVTKHAERDENGDDWDSFINKKADIIFKIKEQGSNDWLFISEEIKNNDHNSVVRWNAPNPELLKNKTYEWELVDKDSNNEEFMASGSFNPFGLTNVDNEITSTYSDPNGVKTEIKIYYFIQ